MHCCRFIQSFEAIASPLTDLLTLVPWHWTKQQSEACTRLKQALTNATVITFPGAGKPFTVGTDAADCAVGAVLQHDHGQGSQTVA
jgi:hypothetical protein